MTLGEAQVRIEKLELEVQSLKVALDIDQQAFARVDTRLEVAARSLDAASAALERMSGPLKANGR